MGCRASVLGSWLVAAMLVCTRAQGQPQPEEPPPEQPPPEEPAVDARVKALEERVRALEEALRRQQAEAEREVKAEEKAEPKAPPKEEAKQPDAPELDADGYVEVHYSYNFNRPRNGITNFRGFDNRHDSFTLSNAVLGGSFNHRSLRGRLALQIGHTPSTYYLAEPLSPGTGGADTSGAELFKYIQEARIGWDPLEDGTIVVDAGVFLSPIGIESIAVKDNWNWSRSNLFFGLPFYHTGVMATWVASAQVTGKLMLCNGWNSVVDNNYWKSIETQWIFKPVEILTVSVLYFGGPERARGAPEGVPGVEPWRHLFDAWTQIDATKWLSFALHGDTGFERNRFGTSWWAAGAAYARVQPLEWLYVAARGDVFGEEAAEDALGNTASRIFFPAGLLGSGTLTVDFRPHSNLSIRVEYRHDEADTDMFFEGSVAGDGVTTPYEPNASRQDTLTFGATGWF